MSKCIPITEMRDTAAFSRLVETSPEPITITKNGYDQFVVLRSSDYRDLSREKAKVRLLERMLIAERERTAGVLVSAHDSIAEIKQRHGL